ncbi:MAG: hypothetical protein P8Z49_06740 [Acidobacteriota bacterium]
MDLPSIMVFPRKNAKREFGRSTARLSVTKRGLAFTSALILLSLSVGCCSTFGSKTREYNRLMECATRITSNRSIYILKRGMFCCPKLPKDTVSMAAARRFYYLKAMKVAPKRAEPVGGVADSYWDEENYAAALPYYQKAAGLSPHPLRYIIGEISMYRLLGKWDRALDRIKTLRQSGHPGWFKIADYLEARILYDRGKPQEAGPLFQKAIRASEKTGINLGNTPYTMTDAWFYMAQIRLKAGHPQEAYNEFKMYLSKQHDPYFLEYYNYWVKRLGKDQKTFYDKLEQNWVRIRQ